MSGVFGSGCRSSAAGHETALRGLGGIEGVRMR